MRGKHLLGGRAAEAVLAAQKKDILHFGGLAQVGGRPLRVETEKRLTALLCRLLTVEWIGEPQS
jgi:hypothetical protein